MFAETTYLRIQTNVTCHVHSSFPYMVNGSEQVQVDKSTGFQFSPSFNNNLRLRSFANMLSPRSSNYDRLEGGLGPSRVTKRFAWKKFALGAGLLISLVYLFGPRANKNLPWKSTQQRPMDVPGKSILYIIEGFIDESS